MAQYEPVLLVVEDDFELRALYTERFEEAGAYVLTAAGALDARQLLRSTRPDGCILDLSLVDGDGLALLADLPEACVRVIVTGQSGDGPLRSLLATGVDDVVFKPFSIDEVIARLLGRLDARRQAGAGTGGQAGTEQEAVCPTLRLGINDLHCYRRGARAELSVREARALRMLAEAAGEPVDRETLCRYVYGQDWDPGSRRVDALISRLRRKLECSLCNAHRGLSTVHNHGYRLIAPIAVREE